MNSQFDHGKGMGGHHSARADKDTWLTPPDLLAKLGHFDTDPCCPVGMPWKTADVMYTIEDNGLMQDWGGRVFCNPPYGGDTGTWLAKLAGHGNGVALIFARTETEFFHRFVWDKADGILFLEGRLHFHHLNGSRAITNAGAPSCFVAYGDANVEALRKSGIAGALVEQWQRSEVSRAVS